MSDIDDFLHNLRPNPRRGLNPDFTKRVITEVQERPLTDSFTTTCKKVIAMNVRKPTIVVASFVAMLIVLGGTAYATTEGFTQLPSFLSAIFRSDTPVADTDGDRIVTIDTKVCTIEHWDEAAQQLSRENSTFYYLIHKSSKLTNEQVTQMVQGNCEFADVTTADRGVMAELEQLNSANKNSIIGGYVNDKITVLTPTSLSLRTEMNYNGEIKTIDSTYTHIDPAVIVADSSGKLMWDNLKVGDSVAVKYRASGDALAHSESILSWQNDTEHMTVVYVYKNSPNVAASFDYTKYYGIDFEQVIPCTGKPSGYCPAYGPIEPPRTELDNSAASMVIQDTYMFYENSFSRYLSIAEAGKLREKALANISSDLAMIIAATPLYDGLVCGREQPKYTTAQNAKISGSTLTRDIILTYQDGSDITATVVADTTTNKITAIQCPVR